MHTFIIKPKFTSKCFVKSAMAVVAKPRVLNLISERFQVQGAGLKQKINRGGGLFVCRIF